ncbi:hypothetical protein BJ973_009070 [Actinoplanes tereljensis]|uniref:TIGR02611 family protein n=1 Tax=Paractinoplanes tereljensis TaxID=571912 RepID=A0A919NH94_9ACTN|nr:PGPGW domain-containing protein [Actinoplanes tereljensis]GIF17966.1 hypothetical protein Ate02nite_06960 [Actinoplanes tereljensis]
MSDALDRDSVKDAVELRVTAQRERHRRRPPVLRVLVGAGGFLLSLAGVLLLWAPEFGLPLLVAGLGLLALEFDWAMRARVWTEWRVALLRDRVKRQPALLKIGLPLTLLAVVFAAVWLALVN